MSQMIAGTYEIQKRIGSGGGGVVYLAHHVRLNKTVAVKADKRILTASPEELNQEVKILTQLNQTYIPQVYDFVYQDGVVYSVIDYIEGESLDKLLERGETVLQPQLIHWAFQLLEALQYLHTRPPYGILHGDIKPGNIMVTREGDIRLIDFNIALALGEKGAVRLGYSEGYASPEHYYSEHGDRNTLLPNQPSDLPSDPEKTQLLGQNRSKLADRRRGGVLDARSDIYMLGATLYHLISGIRPAMNAEDVQPLPDECCDSTVAEIIYKAMAPKPEDRFQTAEEMLHAFDQIYAKDPATKKLKKRFIGATAAIIALLMLGGITSFSGVNLQKAEEEKARIAAEISEQQERFAKETEQAAKEALAQIADGQSALERGDNPTAVSLALSALEKRTAYDASAQYLLTEAMGVYDLSDGFKAYRTLELSSEVIKQSLSPDGNYAAILTSGQVNVVELASASITAQLPANSSALTDMVFFENTLIYAGEGELCAYDFNSNKLLWQARGDYTAIALSGDGQKLAAARGGGDGADVFAVHSGERIGEVSFGDFRRKAPVNPIFADPQKDIFVLDTSGNYLAVSYDNGALMLLNTKSPDDDIELFEESEYLSFEGGFYDRYFGFTASDGINTDFIVIDLDALDVAGDMSVSGEMHMIVSEDGFCLSQRNILVRLDVETGEQTEIAYTESGITMISRTKQNTLIKAADGNLLVFDNNAIMYDMHDDIQCDFADISNGYAVLSGRNSPLVRILKLETYDDKQVYSYDSDYAHDEARVSSDASSVMLFSYKCFRIYDADGGILGELEIPDARYVYDQQYRRNASGDFLEILYYDGLIRRYSASDGSLIAEETGTEPDKTLYEEFETDSYRISSPLHGTPLAYDAATGTLIKELKSEDYLTYVTEVNEGLITEYIKASGERYGLLLDRNLETLAYLPNLCDVLPDGTLVFDDMRGNLRKTRIYSIEELIALAE